MSNCINLNQPASSIFIIIYCGFPYSTDSVGRLSRLGFTGWGNHSKTITWFHLHANLRVRILLENCSLGSTWSCTKRTAMPIVKSTNPFFRIEAKIELLTPWQWVLILTLCLQWWARHLINVPGLQTPWIRGQHNVCTSHCTGEQFENVSSFCATPIKLARHGQGRDIQRVCCVLCIYIPNSCRCI